MKKITWFALFLLTFYAHEGNAQLLTQNFDTDLTWIVGHPSGTSDNQGWSRVTEGNNPSAMPFAGDGMAMFNTYGIFPDNSYDLTSPMISFSGGSYRVSFKMYRDSGSSFFYDNIEVYFNTSQTSVGGTLIGKVNRDRANAPTEEYDGWYIYNFDIPGNPNQAGYISFLATSFYGNNIYLDNVVVEQQPTCLPPGNFTTSVASNSATVSFTPSPSSPSNGYQYELRTVGQAGSGTIGLVASGSQTQTLTILNSLSSNTIYSYYAKAICSATDSSSWERKIFKTLPVAPENDNCTEAITLNTNNDLNCTNSASGTLFGATASGESTPTSIGVPDDDVWYKFTATSPFHRIMLSDIEGSTNDLIVEILGGSCGGSLYNMAISDLDYFSFTDFTVGELYYLRIFSRDMAQNPTTTFKICIATPPPAPLNDNCQGAIPLTPSATNICDNEINGSTISATESFSGCQGMADDDVWYKFVATATLHSVSVTNLSGATDLVFEAFDGCEGTSLKCQDNPDNIMELNELVIGNTYYFRIYTYFENAETSFKVCVTTPPAPPSNDSPFNATVLNASSNIECINSISGTTVSASNSPQFTCNTYSPDVWYTFTPTVSGTYYLNSNITYADAFGYSFVSIYSGSLDNLTQMNESCHSASIYQELVAGTTYYISVASYENSRINFTVCIFLAPEAPENDDIINAWILLPSTDGDTCDNEIIGTTLSATHSSDYDCDSSYVEVWYTFTPQASGEYSIKRRFISGLGDGNITNGFLSIYSNTTGYLGMLNSSCYLTNLSQTLTAGTSYYISVSSTSSYLSFALCATLETPLTTPEFDISAIKAYPNPVKDILNLSYSQEMSAVSIFNLLGQQVFSKSLNTNEARIDMSNLQQGIYLVKINVDNQIKTVRVIKE